MPTTRELAQAIGRLYETFSAYPKPKYTDPCLCCHRREDDEKLRSLPLRELGIDELRRYIDDALTVWGDELVFKHFLPRIFELYFTVNDPSSIFVDPEIVFSKFRYAEWRTWPTTEQLAIEQLLRAVWGVILAEPPSTGSYTDVESWLCSIAQAEDDLHPYLSQWIADTSENSCLALSSFLLGSAVALSGNKGRNGFWEGRDAQYSQLQSWAKSQAVADKLTNAFATFRDPETQSEFEAAIAIRS